MVVGLLGISLVYAYIYANAPKENTWFRLFFLFVSIFTVIPLTWVMFNSQDVEIVTTYTNSTMAEVTSYDVYNYTLMGETRSVMLNYFSISIYIPLFVLALVLVFFIWNLFMELKNKHDEGKGLGKVDGF